MTVGSCEFESHLLHNKLKFRFLVKYGNSSVGRTQSCPSKIRFPTLARQAKQRSLNAEIAQLVEHNLAKVGVASSSLVFRSTATR